MKDSPGPHLVFWYVHTEEQEHPQEEEDVVDDDDDDEMMNDDEWMEARVNEPHCVFIKGKR